MTSHDGSVIVGERPKMRGCYSILFVGDLWSGSTGLHRCEALRSAGHTVRSVDTLPPEAKRQQLRLTNRLRWKLFRLGADVFTPRDLAGVNASILRVIGGQRFDIIWLDKSLVVEPSTLKQLRSAQPNCKIVGYSPDDMSARHCQSRQFIEQLPLYDAYFTTKSYGVAELKARGCRNVFFVGNAFHPDVHKRYAVTDEDRKKCGGPVGFIGDYERARADSMLALAEAGVPVRIWGPWQKARLSHRNLKIENRSLWHEDYGRAICAFDINLCFLRKANRDLQTTRSVEIPACGGFMLAERTDEHLALFEESVEAEFFGSDAELVAKVKHYLGDSQRRAEIADAGWERCQRSGYSNIDRIQQMLQTIESLSP